MRDDDAPLVEVDRNRVVAATQSFQLELAEVINRGDVLVIFLLEGDETRLLAGLDLDLAGDSRAAPLAFSDDLEIELRRARLEEQAATQRGDGTGTRERILVLTVKNQERLPPREIGSHAAIVFIHDGVRGTVDPDSSHLKIPTSMSSLTSCHY